MALSVFYHKNVCSLNLCKKLAGIMESYTPLVMVSLTAGFVIHGLIYAIQILHTPTDPGWTWSSVGTGVGMILKAQVIYCLLLVISGQFHLFTVLFVLLLGVAVYGLPMAGLQIYKKWNANKLVRKIQKEHNFNSK
jgi:hypothetical protein